MLYMQIKVDENIVGTLSLTICFFRLALGRSSVGSALPRRRCCAYITIGMICIFVGVGLTVSVYRSPVNSKQRCGFWTSRFRLFGLCCQIQMYEDNRKFPVSMSSAESGLFIIYLSTLQQQSGQNHHFPTNITAP